MTASVRSPLRWTQESFINLDHKLPDGNVHKNMALRELLQVAKDYGCQLRQVGSNDIYIYHDKLLPHRQGVAVSMGRNDANQAAAAHVRQAVEATLKYREEHPDMVAPPPAHENGSPKTVSIQPVEHPAPRPLPKVSGTPEHVRHTRPTADDICKAVSEAWAMVHYRHHTSESNMVSFGACQDHTCVGIRKAMAQIKTLHRDLEAAEDHAKTADGLFTLAETERDKALAELESVKAQLPKKPSEIITKTPSIENPERAVETSFYRFRNQVRSHWREAKAMLTRIENVMEVAFQTKRDDLMACIETGDFWPMHNWITNYRPEGGSRAAVGMRCWTEFLRVTEIIKRGRRD